MIAKVLVFYVSCFILKVNAQAGYFWHITDHHYDPTYSTEKKSCRDHVTRRGVYGDYWCDSPWKLINDSINAMYNINKNVDFVFWTGDNTAHIKDIHLNETTVMYIVSHITQALKERFPDVKVYATMGNHDWYPTSQVPDNTHEIYNATAALWEDWIGTDQMDTFRKGAYYSFLLDAGTVRIVGLNTNLYYHRNKQTQDVSDPRGQFAWLEEVLNKARAMGEKVILTGHIPPGLLAPDRSQSFYDDFNIRFLDIIRTNADVITSMYFGHDHTDSFKLIQKYEGGPSVPLFIAPSITPWRFKSEDFTSSPHNPGIRLVKYNRITGVPLDIEQYYMDLTESNSNKISDWTLAYTFTKDYGVADLSATEINKVIKKIESDGSVFDKFIKYFTTLAKGDTRVMNCNGICKAKFVCALNKMDRSSYDLCVNGAVFSATAGLYAFSFFIITLEALFIICFY